ncbi:MAG: pentapeptide repeat-containing protein [Nitrospirota bacterium]
MIGLMSARMRLGRGAVLTVVAVGAWLNGWEVPQAQSACVLERERPDQPAMFVRHFGSECTEQEREAQAVNADEVFAALKNGKGVDIDGATIVGDLFFDALPPVKAEAISNPPSLLRDALRVQQITEVRRLAGPIAITHSVVRGTIGMRLKDGYVVVQGPVTLTGTTFERTADFSRMVFLGPVDCSEAVFLSQVFFIQALFAQPARFEKTAFGPHSRFHRSVFGESVSFLRAGFNGLAEFLEVTFEKEASFSRAYFKMGTGFSGSRFGGILDFSEALFEREAFFTFTVFEQDAYFRRSTFRGTADFSDAQFKGIDDFSKVMFDVQPSFARVQVSDARPSPGSLQDPRMMYGIAAVLAVFTLVFILSMRTR